MSRNEPDTPPPAFCYEVTEPAAAGWGIDHAELLRVLRLCYAAGFARGALLAGLDMLLGQYVDGAASLWDAATHAAPREHPPHNASAEGAMRETYFHPRVD